MELRRSGARAWIIGLAQAAFVAVVLLIVVNKGFRPLQRLAAQNAEMTQEYTKRLEFVSRSLGKHPDWPLFMVTHHPWDVEAMIGLHDVLRSVGIQNPVAVRVTEFSPTQRPGFDGNVLFILNSLLSGGYGFKRSAELDTSRGCFGIGFSGESDMNGCSSLGEFFLRASPPGVPRILGISPSPGTGFRQRFTFAFGLDAGADKLRTSWIIANTSAGQQHACAMLIVFGTGELSLMDDAGNLAGTVRLGMPGSVANSQCEIQSGTSSIQRQPDRVAVNVDVLFRPAFRGSKQFFFFTDTLEGKYAGWLARGEWVVPDETRFGAVPSPGGEVSPAPPPGVPRVLGINPSSGRGLRQRFTFEFGLDAGADKLRTSWIIANTSAGRQHACAMLIVFGTGELALMDDAGDVAGTVRVGTQGSVANSQCEVRGETSSMKRQAGRVAVNIDVLFRPAFHGPKRFFFFTDTVQGKYTGWIFRGEWVVPDATEAGASSTPGASPKVEVTGTVAPGKKPA